MRVSLNLIKKYVDIPKDISDEKIAHDITLSTVEVDKIENMSLKYDNIVVGKIVELKKHSNADKLKICMTDIGKEVVQIVCGGTNLYEGQYVVVANPGAKVVWHGEGEAVEIKTTKVRGEVSNGMICASSEVYLSDLFPAETDAEIIDLKGIDCKVGDNISDVIHMNDVVLEIDNKSLSNRPDLWGHYGIARELSAIYNTKLKSLPVFNIDTKLPKYNVEIKDTSKCNRFDAVEIDGIDAKSSPLWMKSILLKLGHRPINAIVDITNYVMLVTGQPLHAFDKNHLSGEKIVVRNAKKGEELLLLANTTVNLTEEDLVICDANHPIGLAGIRGGKNDSITSSTKGIVLEAANFNPQTIRKTQKRFSEKTDSSIRFEKGIDTQRVDEGLSLSLNLIKEIYPESKIIKYTSVYPNETKKNKIKVKEEFLNNRLGKIIPKEKVKEILSSLGYEVSYNGGEYDVTVPTWRSTADVTIKDDVMGDIARILTFDSFEIKPFDVTFTESINQKDALLERRVKEYLSQRCGFYEIYTYPWIDERFIKIANIDKSKSLKLSTPPAPELSYLRSSLIPGMLEAISKNLRYYEEFKIFELSKVYEKGDYRPSSNDEVLPIQKRYLTGSIVGKDAKKVFYEAKGVIENISKYCHMEPLVLKQIEKISWADINAYVNIILNDEIIGSLGLLSIQVMDSSKIKRTNAALFEINFDKFIPYKSRTNKFEKLPELPLVEKDLSIIVDEEVKWSSIIEAIGKMVKEIDFVDEYRGEQIPKGKKSITFNFKIINKDITMKSEEINEKIQKILEVLNKKCGAKLREE